ncbi:MAG TPA: MarR family transcriptional regulator [Holophagaceae bacterium]|nr:MarR family transcriptional regulator [Holophagaceae bacterium]
MEDHLGYWLRRVSNHVSGAFATALEGEGVSVAEWVVLRLMHGEPPQAQRRLAEATGMTPGALSKVLDKLEAKGWAIRATAGDDLRVQRCALTRQGRARVPRLAHLADLNEAHCFDALSPRERATLRAVLLKLVQVHGLQGPPLA